MDLQGEHPSYQGKQDLECLGTEDRIAVRLTSIPDVDEVLETLQFKHQFPELLKQVNLMHHHLCTLSRSAHSLVYGLHVLLWRFINSHMHLPSAVHVYSQSCATYA